MGIISFFFGGGEAPAGAHPVINLGDTKTVDGYLFQYRRVISGFRGERRNRWEETTAAEAETYCEQLRKNAAYWKANAK